MTLELIIPPPARPPTLHSLYGSSVVGDAFRHPPTLTAGCGCLWPLCCSFVFVAAETTRSAAPVPCGADRHHLHGGRVPGTVYRWCLLANHHWRCLRPVHRQQVCHVHVPYVVMQPCSSVRPQCSGHCLSFHVAVSGGGRDGQCQPFDRGTATVSPA